MEKVKFAGRYLGRFYRKKYIEGKEGNNILNNMENKKMRFGGELPGPGILGIRGL
nr:MAG TPA: hypothetical protein [Caudoviricetes sp.]